MSGELQCVRNFFNWELKFELNIHKDGSDNIWFKDKEIATLLGYKNTKDAIIKHIDEEDKKKFPVNSRGRETRPLGKMYWCTFIDESGLYSLVIRSKLPAARKFTRWITRGHSFHQENW